MRIVTVGTRGEHGRHVHGAWHSPEQVAGEGLSTSVAIFEHIP
jgi:hypothetical protein